MNEVPEVGVATRDGGQPFRVGEWDVDPALLEISREGEVRHLEPRVMDLLVCMATRAGKTISREEFLESVWGDRIVVEAVLTQGISQLRQAFDDDRKSPRYVQTVHRRGYRLVAPVKWQDRQAAAPGSETAPGSDTATSSATSPSRVGVARRGRFHPWVVTALVLLSLLAFIGVRQRLANRVPRTYPSIAVLPFENLSAESEEYLAIGMTEMLITDLAKIPDLKVISFTSAMRYRESAGAIPAFAREVGVETVLKGSVSRSAGQLRVIAHLLSGETGELLWAQSYERELVDLLGLQSEISYAVAREIQGQLSLDRVAALAHKESVDAEAYREYLKGRLFWNRRSRVDLRTSKGHFEAAIRLAPDFALAHAGLADALIQLSNYLVMRPEEALPRAEELTLRALELDPDLAEAHATLGLVRTARDWDWPAAEKSYRRAIELQPGYATAHQWYAECLSFMGRHSEALDEIQRAVELDPLSPLMLAVWGQRLNAAGHHREAIDRLKEAVDKDPQKWVHRELAYAYRWLGDIRTALVHHRLESGNWTVGELRALDLAIAADGDAGFWRTRLSHLMTTDDLWVPAIEFAEVYAALGQTDHAFEWLSRAVEERSEYFPHRIKSPLFDSLADDPRFISLLEKSGVVRRTAHIKPKPESSG